MPTVAVIDGVKIQFYADEHPPPHCHATAAEFVALIRIEPLAVLQGDLPPAKRRIVLDWASQRRDLLMEAWNSMAMGRKPRKIT